MEKKLNSRQLAEHKYNVINAAYTYHNLQWMTIANLATSFKVSGNQITEWLCEAIAKMYLPDISVCEYISQKHINEYESLFNITSNSLRGKYQEAFAKRKALISESSIHTNA